jgi:uncharacterized repeat protein (TIGR03809 family)
MSERQQSPYDNIARRWLALVERRQAHFIELCDTGRWRHYYSHAGFLEEMRKVLHVRGQWAAIAGLPPQDDGPEPITRRDRPRLRLVSSAVPVPVPVPVPGWPD